MDKQYLLSYIGRGCLTSRQPTLQIELNGFSTDTSQKHASESVEEPEARRNDKDDEEKDKEKKPFLYCQLVASYPVAAFVLTLSGHLLLALISAILVSAGYDLFPAHFETLPMEIYNVPWRPRNYAWQERDQYDDRYYRFLSIKPIRARGLPFDYANINLYYDTHGGNILTKENLLKIQSIEQELMSSSDYAIYCQLDGSGRCVKPSSILRYFDGTYASLSPLLLDERFENISGVLYAAYENNQTRQGLLYFLHKSYKLTPTTAISSMTRSQLPIGIPLENVTSRSITKEILETYLVTTLKPKVEDLKSRTKEFDFVYDSWILLLHDTQEQACNDMKCAIGSVIFIFLFMVFHTRSLWITTWALLSICTSFLGTNLIYRIVLDFRYFGYFHIIAIFIILGIGADDLFVFYDTWRGTAYKKYPSLAHRLDAAYRKSAISMFITSLTTMVAFFASGLSPLLATQSFGIFSGILVIINYISVIVFFPTVVVMYHLKFEKCFQSCCPDRTRSASTVAIGPRSGAANNITNATPSMRYTDGTTVNGWGQLYEQPKAETDGIHHRKKKLVRFFRRQYFWFVTHRKIRWIILLVLTGVIIFFASHVPSLKPDNEQLEVYSSSHNYGKARNLMLYSFVTSDADNQVKIYISWGLKPKDRSKCHFSALSCNGEEVYDEHFDPNTPEAQMAMKNFCDRLFNMTDEETSRYKIKRDTLTNKLEIRCFTRNLEVFLTKESRETGLDLSLPWDRNKTLRFMESKPWLYNVSRFDQNFTEYLEIAISYWLYNGYSMKYTEDFGNFNSLIGEEYGPYSTSIPLLSVVKYGNRLKYIGVEVNTTLNEGTMGYATGMPILNLWESFVQRQVSEMPDGLKGGFQLTRTTWLVLAVQETLVHNAVFGVALGISLAFPIITLATQNIIIGFFATLSIGCTTVCVIGVIPLAGWKLGVLVSLNMCLLVGISVDYVVHLAEGYHLSKYKDRLSRVRDMLEDMGISVFCGACSTLGASMFMFGAEIRFFLQFGVFMFCTVGFSILFSLGLFTTLMGLFGPENNTGSISPLLRWCFRIKPQRKGSITTNSLQMEF